MASSNFYIRIRLEGPTCWAIPGEWTIFRRNRPALQTICFYYSVYTMRCLQGLAKKQGLLMFINILFQFILFLVPSVRLCVGLPFSSLHTSCDSIKYFIFFSSFRPPYVCTVYLSFGSLLLFLLLFPHQCILNFANHSSSEFISLS